jgi:arylsulfatase A
VPLIASWPRIIKEGGVNRDLIGAVDFLPTLCEAAGVPMPSETDGISFFPQLRGEQGSPREWLYTWYSPRHAHGYQRGEFAFDHGFKLYRYGRFSDVSADPVEERPLDTNTPIPRQAIAIEKLQAALDHFEQAAAAQVETDRQFDERLSRRSDDTENKKD